MSAAKSASDSNEELNFQYPGPLLKLFMLILTVESLWSECGKPSVLVFVILVRDVVSEKMQSVLEMNGVGFDHVYSFLPGWFVLQTSWMSKFESISLIMVTSLSRWG